MSRLDLLAIQGVRSFGTEDKDRQTMKFFSPMTLILGPNGTGKTTIIECLKYITTGEFPPGAKVGGAFVHDPKIANEKEVRAKVGLEISDVTGKKIVVTRKLVASQKVKSVTIKTLESTIKRETENGEFASISSRCAEIDREMVAALGVSKAVLENVIFCHQEDSNWPLGEGKMVKQKFDDIFASTRYTKALDSIKDAKKKQDGVLKECSIEIPHLRNYKRRAEELMKDVEDLTTKTTATKDHIKKLDVDLEPIEEQLEKISKQSNEIYKLQTQIEKHRGRLTEMDGTRDELVKNITKNYNGTTDELKRELNDFQNRVKTQQCQLDKTEHKLGTIEDELDRLQKQQTNLFRDQGQLQQEAKQNEDYLNRRNQRIVKLAEKYSFIGFDDVTEDDVGQFMGRLRGKQQELNEELRDLKQLYETKQLSTQKKIDHVREQKVKLEQTEYMNNTTIRKHGDEMRDIKRQIQQATQSASKLQQIEDELSKSEEDLVKEESSVDLASLEAEVKQLAERRVKLNDQIKDLDNKLREMNRVAQQRSELEAKLNQKAELEKKITTIMRNHKDTLQHQLGPVDRNKVHEKLDDLLKRLESDRNREKMKQDELNKKQSGDQAKDSMIRDQLQSLESEQQSLRRELEAACGSQDVDNRLERVQAEIKLGQDERGSLMGASHFFRKYIKELEEPDSCCPLCKRDFGERNEAEELVAQIQGKMKVVPTRLQQADEKLTKLEKKSVVLLQLKPKQDRYKELTEKNIPQLNDQLLDLTTNISKYTEEIEDCQGVIEARQMDFDEAKVLQPDIQQMPNILRDIAQKDREIDRVKARFGDIDTDQTVDDVNAEKDQATVDSDTVNRQLDTKREKVQRHKDILNNLRQQVVRLKNDKLMIQKNLQDQVKLRDRQNELNKAIEKLNQDTEAAHGQIPPLEGQIAQLEQEKYQIQDEKSLKIDITSASMNELKDDEHGVTNLQLSIEKYKMRKRDVELKKCESEIQEISVEINHKKDEQIKLNRDIDATNKEIANQQTAQRNLSDNLSLRAKETEIEILQSQIEDLEKKRGNFDTSNLVRQQRELERKREEYKKERNTTSGRLSGYVDQIREKKKEIDSAELKNADTRLRDKVIIEKTTQLAKMDLEKYYFALDKSIMKYHSMKMSEINKIIRDLWRCTYKGNDIETIEIRSDADESVQMKTRKTYSYRVVMVKGETAIDMRGRCSAGQKVLASLIIRLALSETFCANCGILALDEPTTNLDRENIGSLAMALLELIKNRCDTRNYQLVAITHDEDFVELLGTSDYVDYFYRIGRNEEGKSVIKRDEICNLRR